MVVEESLQGRYRLTILGGGPMGIRGGDNAIRRVGIIVTLVQADSMARMIGVSWLRTPFRTARLMFLPVLRMLRWRAGEKFYVTSVYVGSDVVTMGLLSTRMIPGSTKTSQVWATANFFFDKETWSKAISRRSTRSSINGSFPKA